MSKKINNENDFAKDQKVNNSAIHQYLQAANNIKNMTYGNRDFGRLIKQFAKMNESVEKFSKQLVELGVIENIEAVKSLFNSVNYLKNFDIISQIKMHDTVISFSKAIKENLETLEKLKIPHATLYKGILCNLEESDFQRILSLAEENISEEKDKNENSSDSYIISQPAAFDTALKINMYIVITNDNIENDPNINETEKSFWKNKLLPILIIIYEFFINWATGSTPFSEMQIVKSFENIIEVVDEYSFSIEEEVIGEKMNKEQLEDYLYKNFNLASDFRFESSNENEVTVINNSRILVFPTGVTEEDIDKIALDYGLIKK